MNDGHDLELRRRRLNRSYELYLKYRLRGHQLTVGLRDRLTLLAGLVEHQFLPHYFGYLPQWRLFLRGFAGKRILPDFAVVGPLKSGSSDLAVSLLLHPAILTPLAKEFHMTANPRDPSTWAIYYPTERAKRRHAKKHGQALAPYLGPYLQAMDLVYRFAQVIPDAKIILTLRNPVQRFYSHWKWDRFVSGKREVEALPFLANFPEYVEQSLRMFPALRMHTKCGITAIEAGIYWRAVEYWTECFGRDSVMVLDMGEYFRDRNSMLATIYDFIGIPFFEIPAAKNITNENPLKLPPPDDDSLAKLREFYAPHNEKLWTVIGKEFDW